MLCEWILVVVNSSLSDRAIPSPFKEIVVCPLSLNPTILNKAKLVLLVTFNTIDHGILLDQLRIGGGWHSVRLVHLLSSGLIPVRDDWVGEVPPLASTTR